MRVLISISLMMLGLLAIGQEVQTEFTDLDAALRSPKQVEVLILKRERLKAWPDDALREFPNLRELNLTSNKIDSLPTDISYLQNLEILIMTNNKLDSLPKSIGQLTNLRLLHLGNNDIYHVSPALADLEYLEEIELWSNNIYYLPEEMSKLKNLKVLDLRNIQLNKDHQADIKSLFDKEKVRMKFSQPCNCG